MCSICQTTYTLACRVEGSLLVDKFPSPASAKPLTCWPDMLQDPFLWTGSDVRIREPDMPTIHFAVAFKGASWSDPDSVALMVMQVSSLT